MKETLHLQPTWARRVVYLQVAVQAVVALTPFYAATVHAAASHDERMLSASAKHTSALGQAVQSGSLNDFAAQQASGITSQALQQWLSNFGTARVEMGTSSHFKPQSGAADLLLPLYKSEERLLFTQNGVRNVDGLITGNFGLGQRHFTGKWMFGYNAFYDQNLSRGHKRAGAGAEAWRDYLKLSTNGYYRLSKWRNSRDVMDYDARPANGFDLRAEAWLPTYPALGGKLIYEKYYGDEVALFGKDRRQKNPDAVTAGLSYTPVPLISFSADHKRGGSQNDTRFGLQLTYQFGQSLTSHLNASAVNLKRELAGSGMDLVERNNNIVLEYRKQQLIDLVLPKEITGKSGSTVPINYQLTSKYGLAKILWNDTAINAAGGKIHDLGGGKFQLVLPKYTAGATNNWPLSGVAYDSRDNASKVATTTVTVTRPVVSSEKSSVTASPEIILADGASTSVINITLNDENGMPVTGLAADISATLKEEQANVPITKVKAQKRAVSARPASLSEVIEQGNGLYTLTLTAGTRPMLAVVSPALGALALPPIAINQISDAASATVKDGDLKLTIDNAVANASASNTAQARVTDATGNPVAGVAVTFALSGAAQIAPGSSLTTVSDANGNASVSFTSAVAETVTITATTATGGSAKVNAKFIADRITAALAQGDLKVDRISALANGSDKVTYSAVVKDAQGNTVPDVRINWFANGGSLAGSSSITGTDGKATITLTNTVAQMVQTSAAAEGGPSVNAPVVSFGADATSGGIGQNDLTVSKSSAIANGTDSITFTVTVKDAHGNLLAGQTVDWQSSEGNLSAASSITSEDGLATISLVSLQATTAQVAASLANKPAINAPQVSFSADASSAVVGSGDLRVNKVEIISNNVDASTFTAVVKDANGNPVANYPVSWATDRGNLNASSSTTNASGEASIRLTGTLAGIAQVTVSVNGNSAVNAPQVTVIADSSSARIDSGDLMADKTTALANSTDVVTYTAIVKDANGNPVPRLAINWNTDLGNLSAPTSTTDASGTAMITLTSAVAGSATVTAKPGIGNMVSTSAVSFTADGSTATIGSGDLSVNKTTVVANNIDNATYTAFVKDANGNPVSNQTVSWSTTRGTLSSNKSVTNSAGLATIELHHTVAESAMVTATVNTASADAQAVMFIADVTTAKVDSIISDKTIVTGTGVENAILMATVTDAHRNPVSGYPLNWSSTLGTITGNGDTGATGVATATYTAPVLASTNNGVATIQASGKTVDVTVRAVLEAGGKYFWTMESDHSTRTETIANGYCADLGGGVPAQRADFNIFAASGKNFKNMSVTGEFRDARYYLGGEWRNDLYADYNSDNAGIGIRSDTLAPSNNGYVCVK